MEPQSLISSSFIAQLKYPKRFHKIFFLFTFQLKGTRQMKRFNLFLPFFLPPHLKRIQKLERLLLHFSTQESPVESFVIFFLLFSWLNKTSKPNSFHLFLPSVLNFKEPQLKIFFLLQFLAHENT